MRITSLFMAAVLVSCGESKDDDKKVNEQDLNLNTPEGVEYNVQDLQVYKDCVKPSSADVESTISVLADDFETSDCLDLAKKVSSGSILWLRDKGLTDLSSLSGLPNLNVLYASGNDLSDLSFVKGLGLELLDVSNNNVESIEPLVLLDDTLTTVWLTGNPILDYSPLEALEKVNWLEVGGANFDAEITNYLNLEALYITGAGAQNLNAIKNLAGLYRLKITGAELEDTAFLDGVNLPSLTYLSLADNYLSDMSSTFVTAPQLIELDMSSNEISDLTFVTKLPKVVELDFSNNLIEDVSPLLELQGLNSINFSINLDGNNVTTCPSEAQSSILFDICSK